MGDAGKVQGEKLADLFDKLVEKKIIISMNVVGAGFDRLTCINGIDRDRKTTTCSSILRKISGRLSATRPPGICASISTDRTNWNTSSAPGAENWLNRA